jgi:tetratricopeptide (TPR) repeat protein
MSGPAGVGVPIGDVTAQVYHLLAVGQTRRARELAASLVSDDPQSAVAHIVLSQVLQSIEELDGAQAAADEAVRLAPDDERAHRQRARVLFGRGRFAGAEAAVLETLALDPEDADAHLLYARLLGVCERHAAALAEAERAIELDPDEPEAHQLRAYLLLHTNPREWTVSEEAVRRSLSLDPHDADAHAVLGVIQLRAGRTPAAESAFRASLTIAPANPLALRGLAEAVMAGAWLYRPFLKYSLFMERASPGIRLAIVAGAWVLVSAMTAVLSRDPATAGAATGISYAYIAFCLYTWFAAPITRFLLSRRYPWLKDVHV